MPTVRQITVRQITNDYWVVYDLDGNEMGSITGNGPTTNTRFKVISAHDCATDPDAAPAFGYGRTLEEAVALITN